MLVQAVKIDQVDDSDSDHVILPKAFSILYKSKHQKTLSPRLPGNRLASNSSSC